MSAPRPDPTHSRTARRERLVGLLLLGIAAVLVVSTPTWFASDQAGVGIGQLVVAGVLGGAGAVLVRRSGRG
jgi:uncharacterized membrane-anchored protein